MVILIALVLLLPSLAQAAYLDSATVLRYEQDSNGSARLIMRFQGNSGEPIVDRPYPVTSSSSFAGLRNWVSSTVTELNLARTAGTAPQVAAGTVVNGLAPVAPTPTAKGVWRAKAQIYDQVCSQGFAGAVATACTALKSDIESTYAAGFLDAN